MKPVKMLFREGLIIAVSCFTALAAAEPPPLSSTKLTAKLPPPIKSYVEGWQKHDGRKVDSVVSDFGGYRDSSMWAPIAGADLADYVKSFKAARFELTGARETTPGNFDLEWKIVWPDKGHGLRRGELPYVDHVMVENKKIKAVTSDGGPIHEEYWSVINDYFKFRETAQVDKTYALFGDSGVLEAKILPPGGITGERLRHYFDGDSNQHFMKRPNGVQQMTKDGRAAVDFQINHGDVMYATGRELMTIESDRIVRLRGIF